ncbi:DNA/RNA helicase domain-containing protein, partial [Psychroflexus sp. MES1-P1E]|uniref:DNA/RNA helicase domain-containing protein n=1 Tax=Psychroflexus sp. MES1-P1E TaxID=2058320 RepID=UPI000C7B0E7A
NDERAVLDAITIIGSSKFNKSATLDIESQLIQYLSAESTYTLQNGNGGLSHHNYYDREFYRNIFIKIWDRLKNEKIVSKNLEEIENSNLFKYSPYKALTTDQHHSIISIIKHLNEQKEGSLFIEGSAGTGKTILATYLMKLLLSQLPSKDEIEDFEGFKIEEYNLLKIFKDEYKDAKIALVVPMTSLRKSLKNVFKSIGGLKTSMVIGPSDVIKEKYDILIVDEAHRLAQRKNIPNYGSFDATNRKLGLDKKGTQLDWVLMNSKKQIFFYDQAQSVKPSDIPKEKFDKLKQKVNNSIKLTSQMRVIGGSDYISFVDHLLNCKPLENIKIPSNYELRFFDDFDNFYNEILKKEEKFGLCRMISGYSWQWVSKNDKTKFDININNIQLQWNNKQIDWINNADPSKEVGCIHTTQGYDLNYAGIIFGEEITYNKESKQIEIIRENYHDRNGKAGVYNDDLLREYIINIYKTIMYRGIRGTFVYACNNSLKEYFTKSKMFV